MTNALFDAPAQNTPTPGQAAGSAPKRTDVLVHSVILRSDKPNKPLEAAPSNNPNKLNALIGFLDDGTKVLVYQRPGKGGIDFNKLINGKIYAVAADGFSPVYEKDENKKYTKVQKLENSLPVYTCSGFYTLSNKEYPAHLMQEVYSKVTPDGSKVLLTTQAQINASMELTLSSDFDLDLLQDALLSVLGDDKNLVAPFTLACNTRRKRAIDASKLQCEDDGETYGGVTYADLEVSKKDGNAAALISWKDEQGAHSVEFVREEEVLNEDGNHYVTRYLSAEEVLERFVASALYSHLSQLLAKGIAVPLRLTQAHVMRTSVSFRRKVKNIQENAVSTQYGDAVYIVAASQGWAKAVMWVLFSMHPNFPTQDYDALHYVACLRQSEVFMKWAGSKYLPPQVLNFDMGDLVFDAKLSAQLKKAA